MKQISRDSWLGIGLFIVLLFITFIAVAGQTAEETAPPLASYSAQPDGAKALRLWLAEIGYEVSVETLTFFQPPPGTSLIFILEPLLPVVPEEWQELDRWVEDGGTLVLVGDRGNAFGLAGHYDFSLRFATAQSPTLTTQAPLWVSPPIANPAEVRPRAYLQTDRDDFVTYMAIPEGPVLVSFAQGAGQVILSSIPFPFTNKGLKEVGNPSLILNIVAMAGQSGTIWFDEWHHGIQKGAAEIVGPGNWLRYTPAGRSLLYVALVIFMAIILQGRRFGRPVPLARNSVRRAPLEHITAIANLSRRAGHRQAVLAQYKHQLKRGLGQRYRLNPTLPDDEYVAQLGRLNPNLDTRSLRTLLDRLGRSQIGESEFVDLAAEVTTWLKET
jgi:hypothetical protein